MAPRLFDENHTQSPDITSHPHTLGSLYITSTFTKKMMEVIRQHRTSPVYVSKHHYGIHDYGIHDYGIRSPTSKITFRHHTFIWLDCEKKCGVSDGEHHMKEMEAAAELLEKSTPLTPSNYAHFHSSKLKLSGKHVRKKVHNYSYVSFDPIHTYGLCHHLIQRALHVKDSYVNTSGKAGAQIPHPPLGDDSPPWGR
jgi:hypothetical protein